MEIYLEAHQPFSLNTVIHSHGWYQLAPFSCPSDGTLQTILRLDGGRNIEVLIRGERGGVVAAVQGELTGSEVHDLQGRVAWMLDLHRDFEDFYKLADREPKLQHARSRAQGRLLRSPTVFEDVVKTILTTNTSWAGTKRMTSSLVELYGSPAAGRETNDGRGLLGKAFPEPERLAAASVEELRSRARLGYRAPYVFELSCAAAAGWLRLEELKHSDWNSDELYRHFLDIKGLGPYAAAHLVLLLGRYAHIPVDSWAKKLVSEEWYRGEPIGDKEIRQKFEAWGDWKALAFWLWDWDYQNNQGQVEGTGT